MRRSEYIALAERLLAHVTDGTTDSAESVKHIPVRNYLEPVRWQREMDQIFRRLPLLLALTCELRETGDYKSIDVVGLPVLMVRGDDGIVRAFIRTCTHRGTLLTEEGKGQCDRFTCPYHGWTFDDRGALVGVAGRHKFGEIRTASRGLVQLPSAERAGMIFVRLTPGAPIDLEQYLEGMMPELESFGLENWHLYRQNELPTSNWKVAHDGYLEGYHFSTLHPNTIAKQVMNNIMTYDAYGPHQRVGFPTYRIHGLREKAQKEWETEEGVSVVRTIFPNVSFAIGLRGGLMSQLLPGPTPQTSRTIQNHIYPRLPANDEERAQTDASVNLFMYAVEKEDNWVCAQIQRGLASGGNQDFVFGKNELGLHRLHESIDYYLSLSSEELFKPSSKQNGSSINGHGNLSQASEPAPSPGTIKD
ncbi:MAG: aromatic ring-hydroxylating dioxygenase subunit alpha [Deltaproteobacteria bacterium]|jgi:phenylpropionate dioxygenase-like ring-hydroxylating dioxygenase large terminal subunit|nr:aromatic ring-hydroxylating dioxygenase subunit alpha [Deltaproteobacteria bacterium]